MRCLHVTDLALGGGYGGLGCLPVVPLAMFDPSYLSRDVWPRLPPAFKVAALRGLAAAANWLREIITSYGFAQHLNLSQVRSDL